MKESVNTTLVFHESYLILILPIIAGVWVWAVMMISEPSLLLPIAIGFIAGLLGYVYFYFKFKTLILDNNQLIIKDRRGSKTINLKDIRSMRTTYNWPSTIFGYEILLENEKIKIPVMSNEKKFQHEIASRAGLELVSNIYKPFIAINYSEKLWERKS
jgi:hypothetical protein